MDIKDFVKTTLAEIISAVKESQNENPEFVIAPMSLDEVVYCEPTTIEFELSLEVTGEGKIGIKVVEGKVEGKQIHKVKFGVPVHYSAKWKNK